MTDNSPSNDELSAVKLALLAQRTRTEVAEVGLLGSDPIAIIGMGCRFPGGADSPEAYWDLVRAGTDAITEVPADRWNADAFFDEDPYARGTMNSRFGGFVDGLDRFDNEFFNIPPREAELLDPQQRLWLEVAIEALERAGQPIDGLGESATGVFVASTMLDYLHHLHAGPDDVDAYTLTGNVHFSIANRLSYLLDLRGPSVALDTACSSSLVAVHLAVQSLRTQETDLAIAGAVNVLLSPETSLSLAKWGLFAPDGRCKTFDDRADGFVRSEGSGAVVLKRLADALAAGDRVHAVIRGSAVNQDGRSTTMTAPNGPAQEALIRDALANARLGPERISVVEAHGTGTELGDPIEVEALKAVLDQAGPDSAPIALTAAKTNVGHLEAAAGMAGLLRLVASMEAGQIPPTVHFTSLNRHLSLDDSRLYVPTELERWEAAGPTRVAGISSFGFGGTNAHLVIEEAPLLPAPPVSDGPFVLPVSARSDAALRDGAEAMAAHLATIDPATLGVVAGTAGSRRAHHEHRLALVGSSPDELIQGLRDWLDGAPVSAEVAAGVRRPGPPPRVGFVFSGQGPQWFGMGRELLASNETFRSVLQRCDELLQTHVPWSLLDELARDEETSRLAETEIAQPALFAIQVALTAVWADHGVRPHAVTGHSVGEVAAAHVAGIMDLETAIAVVANRGRVMQAATGNGAMTSVERSPDEVTARLASHPELAVAAINGPTTTVVAGPVPALDAFEAEIGTEAPVRRLPVDYAFHHPSMVPHGAKLEDELRWLKGQRSRITFVSTVSGEVEDGTGIDAGHWARGVAEPVRFASAMSGLASAGVRAVVEIGPHPVLRGAIADCIAAGAGTDDPPTVVVGSLQRRRPERRTILGALAQLHCAGVDVAWAAVNPARGVADLPTYPWQRQRFWTQGRPSGAGPAGGHPFLGVRRDDDGGHVFETSITPTDTVLLDHHRIGGVALLPAMAMVDLGLSAWRAVTGEDPAGLVDLELLDALPVPDGVGSELRVRLDDDEFLIESMRADRWVASARGRVLGPDAANDEIGGGASLDPEAVGIRCPTHLDGTDLYRDLAARGVDFGSAFQSVVEVDLGEAEAIGRILPTTAAMAGADGHVVPPAVIDAALHPAVPLLDDRATVLPVAIARIDLRGPLTGPLTCHVRVDRQHLTAEATVADDDGRTVARLTGVRMVATDPDTVRQLAALGGVEDDLLLDLEVEPAPEPTGAPPSGLVVLDRPGGPGQALVDRWQADHPSLPARLVAEANLDGSALAPMIGTLGGDPLVVSFRAIGGSTGAASDPARLRATLSDGLDLVRGLPACRLVVVTTLAHAVDRSEHPDPVATAVSAFAAGVGVERLDLDVLRLDLDPEALAAPDRLVEALALQTTEELVLVRGDRILVGRLRRPPATAHGARRLTHDRPGTLDGLSYGPHPRRRPGPGEIEIEVRATGLNFRDVLVSLDMYPGTVTAFGEECSGVVVAVGPDVEHLRVGDPVMAATGGSFASHVTVGHELVAPRPGEWSWEEAATVPIAFLTAHHALDELGHLGSQDRVLIHAGAGGVGMAAIQLARRAGAEIFATAGSEAKRAHLRSIGVEHVFDSRSDRFAAGVMEATGGRGVDVVLNSLADELIDASVGVVAPGGRFLEIGRRTIWSPEHMAEVRPDIEYHIVYLGAVAESEPSRIAAMFTQLGGWFAGGDLEPLPLTVFEPDDVEDAFRYMAAARHIGKVVVRAPLGGFTIRPDATHLITGGTGGIGLCVARWLIDQGATRLALAARRAPDAATAAAIDELRQGGAEVRVLTLDVEDPDLVRSVLAEFGADLGGIVHAAGVVADGLIAGLGPTEVDAVVGPKVDGLEHLLAAIGEVEGEGPGDGGGVAAIRPDWVVLMSAVSPLLGAAGQTIYSAANGYLDGRAATAPVPTISIGWGPWDRVGMTEHLDSSALARLGRRGFVAHSPEAGVAALGRAMATGADRPHRLAIALDPTRIEARPLLSDLGRGSDSSGGRIVDEWAATAPTLRRAAVASFVADLARRVLGLPSGEVIDARLPFTELGVDSLMAVELRNGIGTATGEDMPATLLFDHPTPDALADHLLTMVGDPAGGTDDDLVGPDPEGRQQELAEIASMSDDEAEAALLAELESGGGA